MSGANTGFDGNYQHCLGISQLDDGLIASAESAMHYARMVMRFGGA
jgi:hypothetical protein